MKIYSYLLLILFATVFSSCVSNNSSHKKFNPEKREHGVLVTNNKCEAEVSEVEPDLSGLKISIFLPIEDSTHLSTFQIMESKMLQLVGRYGIFEKNANPKIAIAPIVDVISIESTSTMPPRFCSKYNVSFYIFDQVTGTIFNTVSQIIKGIGKSKEEAFIAALDELKADESFSSFVISSKNRVIQYYFQNGDSVIEEAKSLSSFGDYEEAIALAKTIPISDTLHYNASRLLINELIPKYIEARSYSYFIKMKAAMAKFDSNSINNDVLDFYTMIPFNATCKKEADRLYETYLANLSSELAKKTEMQLKALDADNAFKLREAELKAEVDGNALLLEKYRKDAAYNRLPWLRKLIYLGDIDPFDGYIPKHDI